MGGEVVCLMIFPKKQLSGLSILLVSIILYGIGEWVELELILITDDDDDDDDDDSVSFQWSVREWRIR